MKTAAAFIPMPISPEILDDARSIVRAEADAIVTLADSLDHPYIEAVDLLVECKGRVIVSGMGKSGHVARKIAATLASTGTPAHFVHPGEASHGDLGMITEKDVVIALSFSGETEELANLISYTQRFNIPLIAITSKADSRLGKSADVTLLLPNVREACPHQLAPTTSTTMMLVLGDALALSALKAKGFQPEDFGRLHPGGSLGKKLKTVHDLMRSGDALPLVKAETLMSEVVVVMSAKGLGCAIVVGDEGKLQGIITDGDLRRHMSDTLLKRQATDIMTRNPQTIGPDTLAAEALRIMNEKSLTTLVVIENQRPTGILHVQDLLRAGIA